MAERGFFAKEMNAGWAEWTAASLPTHAARVARGEIRCECSLGMPKAAAVPKGP